MSKDGKDTAGDRRGRQESIWAKAKISFSELPFQAKAEEQKLPLPTSVLVVGYMAEWSLAPAHFACILELSSAQVGCDCASIFTQL